MGSWWKRIKSGAAKTTAVLRLNDSEILRHNWDYSVYVAVVGFGGAGASAAIETRDEGANVAVVERFNGGGSTAISGSIVYEGQPREPAVAARPGRPLPGQTVPVQNLLSV